MALDLTEALSPAGAPAAYEIRALVDPDRLEDLATVEERVWGEPHAAFAAALGEEMRRRPDGLLVYAAYRHERPVAAGWLRLHAGTGFASLWGGSTLEEHRGRGLYRALVAVRAARARDAGARFLLVDARDSSRPILERLGFRVLTTLAAFVWSPDQA
jgi:GNAT superfamily N-acetyltransferase